MLSQFSQVSFGKLISEELIENLKFMRLRSPSWTEGIHHSRIHASITHMSNPLHLKWALSSFLSLQRCWHICEQLTVFISLFPLNINCHFCWRTNSFIWAGRASFSYISALHVCITKQSKRSLFDNWKSLLINQI